MRKIQKIARISDKVMSVLFWVMAVACGLATFAILALLIVNPQIGVEASTLTVGFLEFTLAGHVIQQFPTEFLVAALIYLWTAFGITFYIMRQLHHIFQPMATGTPFHCTVSAKIRHIAFASLAAGVVYSIGKVGFGILLYKTFHLGSLFLNDNVLKSGLAFEFDLLFVVVFVLLLLLSYVFQYGEELQTLSDETL